MDCDYKIFTIHTFYLRTVIKEIICTNYSKSHEINNTQTGIDRYISNLCDPTKPVASKLWNKCIIVILEKIIIYTIPNNKDLNKFTNQQLIQYLLSKYKILYEFIKIFMNEEDTDKEYDYINTILTTPNNDILTQIGNLVESEKKNKPHFQVQSNESELNFNRPIQTPLKPREFTYDPETFLDPPKTKSQDPEYENKYIKYKKKYINLKQLKN